MKDTDSSRRTHKAVDYAEYADASFGDDDFDDDFKTSSRSKKEKYKDRLENGERKNGKDREASRDKHKKHKKHKDRDRDKEKGERRSDHRSWDEGKRREHCRDKRHRSETRLDLSLDYSDRSDTKYDSANSQTSDASSAANSQTSDTSSAGSVSTVSPMVSPGRRNPKPRLTLEEKIFQKQLEEALKLSETEATDRSEIKESTENEEQTNLNAQPTQSPKSPLRDCAGDGCSVPQQDSEVTDKASTCAIDKVGPAEHLQSKDKLPEPPKVARLPPLSTIQASDLMEPQPSTSTGLGLKRARKTVTFKEDTDSSDDFDGFGCNNADSDASEGSDFMPSPKKKKKRSKDLNKKSVSRTQRSKNLGKSANKTPEKSKPSQRLSSPTVCSQMAKENTAPVNHTKTSTVASPQVSVHPQPKVPSPSTAIPPTKASTTKSSAKPVKRPLTLSPSSSELPMTLVKTPFICPVRTSPGGGHSNTTSASSPGAKSLVQRGIGLRLGLSRRAVKSLHPSVAMKITD